VAGSFEHINEPSGSVRGGKFLDQLSDYQLLKKELVVAIIIISERKLLQVGLWATSSHRRNMRPPSGQANILQASAGWRWGTSSGPHNRPSTQFIRI